MAPTETNRRRLEIGADPRRRRSVADGASQHRGDAMPYSAGCRITFRPENPVEPTLALLEAMCIIRETPPRRLPPAANENLRASA